MIGKGGGSQRTDGKLTMLEKLLQKKRRRAAEDREVGHAGKVANIGKGTDRKSFLAETKGHMVNYMACLALVIFSTQLKLEFPNFLGSRCSQCLNNTSSIVP